MSDIHIVIEKEPILSIIEVDSQNVIVQALNQPTQIIVAVPSHSHAFPLRVIETPSTDIQRNIPHTLPNGLRYTPSYGRNLHILVSGALLTPAIGSEIGDYTEISPTEISFSFDIPAQTPLNYLIWG